MDIIRYHEIRPTAWRNGGGQARELASFPGGSADFDWRVSIAEIAEAGDFSVYSGVERLLTVIDGELLVVTVDGVEHPMEKYRPFRFSGDSASSAALPVGTTIDLNVMARRGKFKSYISIVELSKRRAQPVFVDQFAVLLHGTAVVTGAAAGAGQAGIQSAELRKFDAVRGQDLAPEILGRGFLALITLEAQLA
ncbi:HutD family protein [Cryobacterium suzukii]|uniref:HutD family protein n=1 Tax=Cryobacterium suzukii TaxID=1259198 RepID=A0A4V3ISC5_9MICO|nr:HutD family protein [Cryobacterium suzukii]TFD57718.1 HutD family protein [Cryobacterium suzukii]